ncbi:hypothetical protein D3C76_1168530 [compost metagenome]
MALLLVPEYKWIAPIRQLIDAVICGKGMLRNRLPSLHVAADRMADQLLARREDAVEHMVGIVHFQNMSGSAFDLAGSVRPIIHEIFRSDQMPSMV